MIRKRGLQDVRRRNRQVIIQTILDHDELSRVEIAQKTELAASTVSSLVSELMAEGVLVESGCRTTTAGRSRMGLTINPHFGAIAVVEIGRKEACMTVFDMALQPIATDVLAKRYLSGNELLDTINRAITVHTQDTIPLAGIGLLFQEDMRESDFRVMYSTGIASANITLKEALMSQFRVPVVEEYSQVYTVKQALADHTDPAIRDSAHISIGSTVVVNVTVEGRPVPIRSDFGDNVASVLKEPEYTGDEICEKPKLARISLQISNTIMLLCMIFSLNTVLISGADAFDKELLHILNLQLREKLTDEKMPHLQLLYKKQMQHWDGVFAQRMRTAILAAQ